jgi:hypothetical protein
MDLRKRLFETTSRQFLEEWEKGVSFLLTQKVKPTRLSAPECKCTDVPRKDGETKPSEGLPL